MKRFILYIVVMVVVGIYIKGGDYLMKEKAREIAKQGYISEGCLHLTRENSYKNYIETRVINIDGRKYEYMNVLISDFPFYDKSYNFMKNIKKDVYCYHVQYVDVDFLFYKRRFIYDLI